MARLLVFTSPVEGRDADFDHWYETVHIPDVLALGPIVAAQRFRAADVATSVSLPYRYVTIYEVDGDPAVAVEALRAARDTFVMSDGLGEVGVMVVEERSERQVRSPGPGEPG